jgi:predicted nucleic acid-binding protein
MKVLVDSNMFLDYYLNRSDGLIPIGEFAFKFIQEAIGCKYLVIVSSSVIGEVKDKLGFSEFELNEKVFNGLIKRNKLQIIKETTEQVIKARKLSLERNLPVVDCVQAIIAHEENFLIVSRDFHFNELNDFAETLKPEDLE